MRSAETCLIIDTCFCDNKTDLEFALVLDLMRLATGVLNQSYPLVFTLDLYSRNFGGSLAV